MEYKLTISGIYQEAFEYLDKIKINPRPIIKWKGLNAMYEKAREMKFKGNKLSEEGYLPDSIFKQFKSEKHENNY